METTCIVILLGMVTHLCSQQSEGQAGFAILYTEWPCVEAALTWTDAIHWVSEVFYYPRGQGAATLFQGRNSLIEVIIKMNLFTAGSNWTVVWVKEFGGFLWSPFLLLAFYNAKTLKQC